MPRRENPYFNPTYSEAAEKFSNAIFGNPEKAGQIAYRRATARLANNRADRQRIENNALTGGLAEAITAAGSDPTSIAAGMPAVLQTMAAGGITNPSQFTAPWWAIEGESQSGASPAEALVRAAYAGKGTAIPTDLALTPERQDFIRQDKAKADLTKALAVQHLKNQAPGKPGAGIKIDTVDDILNSVLSGVPGATFTDQYQNRNIQDDVLDYMTESGLYEALRDTAAGNAAGGTEAARRAVLEDLNLPPGARFEPEAIIEPGAQGFLGALSRLLPGRQGPTRGPGFVDPGGNIINFDHILDRGPAAPPSPPLAPAAAWEALLQNPSLAPEFDAKYGAGAAATLLRR